ncbi:MAG: 3-hydroxyacyl-CoA dehydrogenase NAD-binding domain-containing protein, partial [Ignavibacteria bacterium]|nr:3-hydroxyacyl-CoA dehydrogenase NAD-binding domain-containing protein [Ignavibacteria bacterium]
MKKIAVFGSGTMGNGIAHVFALSGFQVQLFDKDTTILARAIKTISSNLDRQLKKNIITLELKDSTLQNIKTEILISNIDPDTELVIEAIIENKSAKVNLYNELLSVVQRNCILATNTSSISITELAPKSHADKFIGMHFMNPVPMMELVEIIKGHLTSEETLKTITDLATLLKKTPVVVSDYPGFIANRILMP